MDKNKALRIEQDDAAAALEQAVSQAKLRVTEMDGGEIDDVAGGLQTLPDILMGFFPSDGGPEL